MAVFATFAGFLSTERLDSTEADGEQDGGIPGDEVGSITELLATLRQLLGDRERIDTAIASLVEALEELLEEDATAEKGKAVSGHPIFSVRGKGIPFSLPIPYGVPTEIE